MKEKDEYMNLNQNDNFKKMNLNIFQKENDYYMKQNLSFNDIEEKNCKKSHFIRNINLIKSLNICIIFFNLIHLIFFKLKFSFSLIRIILIILSYFTILLIDNLSKVITNIFSIRMLVFLIDAADLFLFCVENHYEKKNHFLSMRIFNNAYLMTLIHNYCFCLNLSESIKLYLLITIELLSFYDHSENWFIIRFFKNLFSTKIITIIYLIFISISIQYNMEKPVRRLWALFDSYKKSYFCVKMIYDKYQFGVMIVKNDLSIIYYKNPEAEKFHLKVRGCFPDKCKCTFKDIFNLNEHSIEKRFIQEINNSIIKKSTFIFPIKINNQDGQNEIKNEKNQKYIELYIFNCEWTNKEECYYIQIHEIPFVSNGGLVALENLKKIEKEMTSFVWNLNEICSFAPLKPDNNKKKIDKNINFIKNNIEKSPMKSPDNWNKKNYTASRSIKTPVNNSIFLKNLNFNISPSPNKSPNFIGLLEELKLKNLIKEKTKFDYTFLFYNRFGGNYIYDLILTNYVFTSFIENKEIKDIRRFNFDNFLNYMVNYLTPIAKINNYTIVVKNSLKEEVEANYIYIRAIIFNCIMFIINNSKDQKNKILEISTKHAKFQKSNENYFRLIFQINQVQCYYSYKHLSNFFSQFDESKFKNIDPQQINETIDLGLFVVFLICNIVFNLNVSDVKSFEIKTNPYQILTSIYIPSSANNPNVPYKKFPILDINSDIARKANEKIAAIQFQNYQDKIKFNLDDSEDNKYDNRTEEELDNDDEDYTVKKDRKFLFESNILNLFENDNKYDNYIPIIQDNKLSKSKNNEIIFINENYQKDISDCYIKIKFERP